MPEKSKSSENRAKQSKEEKKNPKSGLLQFTPRVSQVKIRRSKADTRKNPKSGALQFTPIDCNMRGFRTKGEVLQVLVKCAYKGLRTRGEVA